MDEAGTPFCITVDGETLTDQTVTVRDRDTGAQVRVATDQVVGWIAERVGRQRASASVTEAVPSPNGPG
jgi:glycyl-tRNA synthetase (class II)